MGTDRQIPCSAVFLDALGTLVELEPPWDHLRSVVPGGVTGEQLEAAVRAEMAYYREHAHEGRDPRSLAGLRERSAAVLSRELGAEVSAQELVAAIRMRAYPDSAPALEELGRRGIKRIVVSNWDCSLGEVLARCGLGPLLDGALSSAETDSRKPDRGIFDAALDLAQVEPAEALHVGDTPEEDLAGAAAAGIPALLIDRSGARRPEGVESVEQGVVTSLTQIVEYLPAPS